MSNIKIKKHIIIDEFISSILEDDFNYNNLDIYFGFFHEDLDVIEFNTLKFGCDLIKDEKVIQSKVYPDNNINMFKTESEYLQIIRFDVEPLTTYDIKLWCNNVGIYNEYKTKITTPSLPDNKTLFEASHPGETYDF